MDNLIALERINLKKEFADVFSSNISEIYGLFLTKIG